VAIAPCYNILGFSLIPLVMLGYVAWLCSQQEKGGNEKGG